MTNCSTLAILLSIALCIALGLLCHLLSSTTNSNRKTKTATKLPPGPTPIPLLGNLLFFRQSIGELLPIVHDLFGRYGSIFTLRLGPYPMIFVADHRLAHKALVELGAVFSDRPPLNRFLSGYNRNISFAAYGPRWRLLRGNLTSKVLHPSRVNLYANMRASVLQVLISNLKSYAASHHGTVMAVESFRFAMLSLVVLMCFGEKLDEKVIKDIEIVQRYFLLSVTKVNILSFIPNISKYLFQRRNTMKSSPPRAKDLFIPLIKARDQSRKQHSDKDESSSACSYVNSLFEIILPDEGNRSMTYVEMTRLCLEFINAGTDTTSTALQWIMANLVKHQNIQAKLFEEIERVVGKDSKEVREEDLRNMPYLKALILEGLRLHPPGHFLLPHAVKEEVTIEEYKIPKNAVINFMVADMNRDGKVWENPMEFRPERFLPGGEGDGVDITGSREIKMMPFGAGRRICPGLGLAMLHLEYFVANLVREFEWKAVEGEEVDLAEKLEFTVVMEKPLRARLVTRRSK